MYQLIYVSDKTSGKTESEYASILRSARKNNTNNQITGLLLEFDDHFIQILEGNMEQVKATYHRIQQDNRHHNIRLIFNAVTHSREFGPWAMGFSNRLDDLELSEAKYLLLSIAQKQTFNEIDGKGIRMLLRGLVEK